MEQTTKPITIKIVDIKQIIKTSKQCLPVNRIINIHEREGSDYSLLRRVIIIKV